DSARRKFAVATAARAGRVEEAARAPDLAEAVLAAEHALVVARAGERVGHIAAPARYGDHCDEDERQEPPHQNRPATATPVSSPLDQITQWVIPPTTSAAPTPSAMTPNFWWVTAVS